MVSGLLYSLEAFKKYNLYTEYEISRHCGGSSGNECTIHKVPSSCIRGDAGSSRKLRINPKPRATSSPQFAGPNFNFPLGFLYIQFVLCLHWVRCKFLVYELFTTVLTTDATLLPSVQLSIRSPITTTANMDSKRRKTLAGK